MDIMIDHATRSYEAHRLYRELYSCRYQSPLQPFCLLHACDVLIRFSPTKPSATAVVENCLLYLKEAVDGGGGFSVCNALKEMFRRTAIECHVRLPDDIDELMGENTKYTSEMLLDACRRLTYRQPVKRLVANMEDKISEDFPQQPGDRIKVLNVRAIRWSIRWTDFQCDEIFS